MSRRYGSGLRARRAAGALAALAVLAAGALSGWPQALAQPGRPNPIQNAGTPWLFDGFRVDTPPPAGGWVSLSRDYATAQLLRATGSAEHSFVALVATGPVPTAIDSDEALLAAAREIRRKDLDPAQWTALALEEQAVLFQGARCVRYLERVQEAAPGSPGRVMEIRGMLCLHPTLPQRGVAVSVSERAAPSALDGRWHAEGEAFVDSLRFTVPGPREARAAAIAALKAGEPERAAEQLEPMAAAGDPLAARLLAYALEDKRNPRRDDAQAVRWLTEAARQGDDIAQGLLAFRYRAGEGVPRDYAQAQRWMMLAADQRNADAQSQIGTDYLFGGRGLPVDRDRARSWLEMAADNGSRAARDLLQQRFRGE